MKSVINLDQVRVFNKGTSNSDYEEAYQRTNDAIDSLDRVNFSAWLFYPLFIICYCLKAVQAMYLSDDPSSPPELERPCTVVVAGFMM